MVQQYPSVSSWIVPIARWVVWDGALRESGAPSPVDLDFIDPMLRRRLSLLAKMALKVAHDCVRDLPAVQFVYASRHGELTRTTSMLDDLAAGESISPTAFTMAVLNSTAGLFSILRHDMTPSTAISASAESFGNGLLEAYMQLTENPERPVLLVYADEPTPSVYQHIEPEDSSAHAIGLLLQSGAPDTIACTSVPGNHALSHEAQSRAFLRCLEGASASGWHGAGKSWTWRRPSQ
ncbi:MAG: 3-oxoacyl-ACP synthase [Rhodocyclaceae bacterium]|nr:MAG: 3-oxoacyl-ACP synthase [Rhodocyclaceae bacterium]